MSLIGPGKGLIVALSCSLRSVTYHWPGTPLWKRSVTDDDDDNNGDDHDEAWPDGKWTGTANQILKTVVTLHATILFSQIFSPQTQTFLQSPAHTRFSQSICVQESVLMGLCSLSGADKVSVFNTTEWH